MRETTNDLYAAGLRCFSSYAGLYGHHPALPSSPSIISCYLTHLALRGLAVSTIETRAAALQHWHRTRSHLAELSGRPAEPSPLDSDLVRAVRAAIRRRHGRPPRGRTALAIGTFRAMYASGFSLETAAGLHGRLCLLLLNLGCLRRGAAVNIRVNYRITLSGEVLFLGGSHVRVDRDPDLDIEYIELRVFKDKNVREGDAALSYIPDQVASLGIRPVEVLLHYLRAVRPPSGGLLLAAPKGRGLRPTAFYPGPFTQMAQVVQRALARVAPLTLQDELVRVGSHSGRKSLASWLWEAHRSARLIADVGHWRAPGDAFHLYFVSSRRVILDCVRRL